ncbi:MAG TPA: TonB-dependent receptor [Thermoanaerobaculia bacterium]|nr:TonB-dependent receptor [Thermoanaerobaculia bacterium]
MSFDAALLIAWTLSDLVSLGLVQAVPRAVAAGQEIPAQHQLQPDEAAIVVKDVLEVRARSDDLVGVARSATEGVTGHSDLQQRALLRPGELVETVPGVIATQHSGGGKANQYFLRGFNLDHGTDFSARVESMPVNFPSHGHGQGYSDLNFVIPELVDVVRFRKGPYHADVGDFSAAGSVDFAFTRALARPVLTATGGTPRAERLLLAGSRAVRGGDLLAAIDLFRSDGPWERPEDYSGYRGLLRYERGSPLRGWSVVALGYGADWLSTDQVPARSVRSGQIGRFGLIDPGPRGSTRRHSVSVETHRAGARSLTQFTAYLLRYDLDLISDFTYFLSDPERGDQFQQLDRRWVGGLALGGQWLAPATDLDVTYGLDLRYDDIANGLFPTANRVRTGVVRADDIRQLAAGPYVMVESSWGEKVRAYSGLRIDHQRVEVTSTAAANSDAAQQTLVSPKAGLVVGPWRQTEVYLNAGLGYHSNDARGATLHVDPTTGEPAPRVDLLVPARGADVGVRTTAVAGLHTTLTAFVLELDSELMFVGDAGGTEAKRPSRRTGIEWTNHYQLSPHLALELDATWTRARFTDFALEGDRIPGALERTVALALVLNRPRGPFGSLRWRYFGAAPLIEDDSVRSGSSSLINLRAGYRLGKGLRIGLDVHNLLDREDPEIEYFYVSRLPGEPVEGVADVHFHPLPSRSLLLVVGWQP